MKLIVICALIAFASTAEDKLFSEKNYERPEWVPSLNLFNGSFSPKLDHFNPQDTRTVNFNYRLNLEYYEANGPLFVYINDGEQYTTEWIERGLIVDIARDLGGAVITSDHRYFRLNTATETSSFENLRFLTVDQALADIAALIATLREHLASDFPKVIVWGTGYGATLVHYFNATFARKKYPHLIDGAFASSGLFRAEVEDESYYDNLSYNLRRHGSNECHARVKNAFDVLEYLIENGEADYLTERLQLCKPLEVDNDQEVGFLVERFIDYISAYIKQHK
ncbi:putative serine protease K12H4.7 [Pseudolycoriella hygida]|uniref:Serine protease K12H4.7 n=1 Tax=Pseudolycoriella hygida TaxID=35572 RepID=A0A9Q0RSD5_9DIPT|nr:putative serine protease K12H4.7 [Pseudolycoriella hygida]